MTTTDGAAPKDTSADPVLAGALSEMASEGSHLDQPFDSSAASGAASQPSGDASAAPAAADPKTGDAGSEPVAGSSKTPAAPDPSAAPPAAADPLAGTEPFTYTVNGEKKTLDGVYRVPGEGLLVPEDKVSLVTGLAERADVLDRVTREVTAKHADLERLTSWTFDGPDGKTTTLTGAQALETMRVDYARQAAALDVMDAILSDPAKFAQLVGVVQEGDKTKLVVDPTALEYLQKDVMLAANAAERQARSEFQKLGTPPAPSPQSADHSRSAPAIITAVAQADEKILTSKDREFLAQQIGRYVRTVTEDDRRFNPKLTVGAPIVDASFSRVITDRVEMRKEAATAARTAETAGKHNAGMDKGRQPAAKPPAPKAPAPPAQPPAGRRKADWDTPLDSALTEMGITR